MLFWVIFFLARQRAALINSEDKLKELKKIIKLKTNTPVYRIYRLNRECEFPFWVLYLLWFVFSFFGDVD